MKKAEDEFGKYSKSYCRNILGGGWFLHEVKNAGEMNCEETTDGHHCRKKNVELVCKQVISSGFGN